MLQRELIEKLFPPKPKDEKKEDKKPPRSEEPPRPTYPQPPQFPDFPTGPQFPDPDSPFGGGGIFDQPGGADLDPTGRRGRGGMLMEPPRGGGQFGQPRIDPTNPFGRGGGLGGGPGRIGPGRGGRNFGDEMAPPDFDNMFM